LGRGGIAGVVAQVVRQVDQGAKGVPEPLLQRGSGEEPAIAGAIDLEAERAPGEQFATGPGRPAGREQAQRPPLPGEQIVGHRDVEVAAPAGRLRLA
jgi:hypothetical protein